MALNKTDETLGVIAMLLLGGSKALASSTGAKPGPGGHPNPDTDGANLVKRANQAAATAWVAWFLKHPTTPMVAAALARWAGIESSGNALAHSRLNERGLMQAGAQTVAEGGLTPVEWDALIDPKTSKQEQADMAVGYVDWLYRMASHHIQNPPSDPVDQVWYAKLYHQRPVDVRDEGMEGDAVTMARLLAIRWANDPKAMHRLRAANVVAWGTPTP